MKRSIPEKLKIIFLFVLIFSISSTATTPDCGDCPQKSIQIAQGYNTINFGPLNVLTSNIQVARGNFVIKASSPALKYRVWLSVSSSNIDTIQKTYLLKNGKDTLPIRVLLTGFPGTYSVHARPAELQTGGPETAKPQTGKPEDGDGVRGTDDRAGTIYTIELTYDTSLLNNTLNFPQGNYKAEATINVELYE